MTAKTATIFMALALSGFGQAAPPPRPAAVEANTLLDADRKPIPNAQVSIMIPGKKPIEATTDANGKFSVSLPIGDYVVSVHAQGITTGLLAAAVKLGEMVLPVKTGAAPPHSPNTEEPKPCEATSNCPYGPASLWTRYYAAILLLTYWMIALLVRYNNIVKVNRRSLEAAIKSTAQEIMVGADESIREHSDQLAKLSVTSKYEEINAVVSETATDRGIDYQIQIKAAGLIQDARQTIANRETFRTFFFGLRGQLSAGWNLLDEAKRILAGAYTRDQVLSSLRLVAEQLRPEYSGMADKVDATLAKADAANGPSDGFLRATLNDALRCINEKNDSALSALLNWQNKAFALIFIGGCLLFTIVALLDNPILLLLGFIGGFTSRLLRGKSVGSKPDGSEMTWTDLFLSPIYGAFGGWAGILLLIVLTQFKVMGEAFKSLTWANASCCTMGLGLAFVFGFSERLFSSVTDLAVGAVAKDKNRKAEDSADTAKPAAKADVGIPKKPDSKKLDPDSK